jgi:hypothetical protein
MRSLWFAVAFVVASGSTALPNTTDPMAAVRQYVEAFNNGDVKAMAATCAVPAWILDGLPPHVWQGPTACEDWESLIGAVGEGAIGACMLFLALSMAAGHLLGGPDVGTRRVLALGSGQRNIEAVLLIASTSVADPKVLVMAVIAALVVCIMLFGTAVVFRRHPVPGGPGPVPG